MLISHLFPIITVLLILSLFAIFLLWMKFQDERHYHLYSQGKNNPFKKKKFLNGGEIKLFNILQSLPELDNYYIFPQVHLSTVLKVKNDFNDLRGKFDWLNDLYPDFMIFSKEDFEPKLAIELNGPYHKLDAKIARDQFVRKSLEENNIPLLEIDILLLTNEEEIKKRISSELTKLTFSN